MKISKLVSTCALLLLFPGRETLLADTLKQQVIEAGRTRYLEVCSACHGPNGLGGHGPALAGPRIRRASDKQLFMSILNGVPGTEMPPFKLPEQTILHMVAFLRSLTATAAESYVTGDAPSGKALFFGNGGCSKCHMIGGQGGYLGPDLTEIGRNRTLAELRESIIDPNARPTPGFESVTFRDGIKGVAKYRTNYSTQIIDEGGKLHLLRGAETASVKLQPKSWMPPSKLSPEELQNVLAFLSHP